MAGTVLALAAGRGAPTLASRLLGTAPMVWIGDLSYSLYLWHWPFIVTAAAIWPFSTAAPVIAGLASVIPSYFTYRYVEQPFRAQTVTGAKGVTRLVVGILAPPLAVATAAWLALALLVQPAMAPGGALASRFGSVESADVDRQLLPCRDEAMAALSNGLCGTTLDGEASVLLIGDSHAEHLLPAFEAQFPRQTWLFVPERGVSVDPTAGVSAG
ncbi:acyltransferase family protein [Microbacterium sp.]|uniref:acyltransferase family protein n=1 Tax=Microbacterium sp. TaxID=51671 RepID=UPI00260FEA09|nr:acyltransferase family protein [Microbacterium sp.]